MGTVERGEERRTGASREKFGLDIERAVFTSKCDVGGILGCTAQTCLHQPMYCVACCESAACLLFWFFLLYLLFFLFFFNMCQHVPNESNLMSSIDCV